MLQLCLKGKMYFFTRKERVPNPGLNGVTDMGMRSLFGQLLKRILLIFRHPNLKQYLGLF